jgi:putative transposase
VRTFDTIEELRAALVEFATRYNETWLVARHGYRTPAQVRADQCRLDPNTTADLKLAAWDMVHERSVPLVGPFHSV